MKDVLTYKDYIGSVHFSAEDEVFCGKIEGIDDIVSFEGNTVTEIKKAFKGAVEDYIQTCKKVGVWRK
jgi:predicted HicB family RNase H-like nuclease